MHPLSTALFLLGYLLALPIAFRMVAVVAGQHRLALAGHQVGMTIAGLGWVLRGSAAIAIGHVVWMIGVRLWFSASARG